jgi:hypothetical protein
MPHADQPQGLSDPSTGNEHFLGFQPGTSRRAFVALLGLAALAGCAKSKPLAQAVPSPDWASNKPQPVQSAKSNLASGRINGMINRGHWAKGNPVPSLMNNMTPPRYVTIHHDGMDAFHAADPASAQSRLETIRRAHRGRGWGDIGYHFAIDPAGRVWSCRPLTYQGAHVKNHNPGNIGIVVLGNYDLQQVNSSQRARLNQFLGEILRNYRMSMGQVRTHQEWAATRCPGTSLQAYMSSMRS